MIILPPTKHGFRQTDAYGSGHYGASRTRATAGVQWAGQSYAHKGTDWICVPGEYAFCPCLADVTHIGWAYPKVSTSDPEFGSIHFESVEHPEYQFKLFYVRFTLEGTFPIRVAAGEAFGICQDLRLRYPGPPPISPHVHLEARLRGTLIDPVSLLAEAA